MNNVRSLSIVSKNKGGEIRENIPFQVVRQSKKVYKGRNVHQSQTMQTLYAFLHEYLYIYEQDFTTGKCNFLERIQWYSSVHVNMYPIMHDSTIFLSDERCFVIIFTEVIIRHNTYSYGYYVEPLDQHVAKFYLDTKILEYINFSTANISYSKWYNALFSVYVKQKAKKKKGGKSEVMISSYQLDSDLQIDKQVKINISTPTTCAICFKMNFILTILVNDTIILYNPENLSLESLNPKENISSKIFAKEMISLMADSIDKYNGAYHMSWIDEDRMIVLCNLRFFFLFDVNSRCWTKYHLSSTLPSQNLIDSSMINVSFSNKSSNQFGYYSIYASLSFHPNYFKEYMQSPADVKIEERYMNRHELGEMEIPFLWRIDFVQFKKKNSNIPSLLEVNLLKNRKKLCDILIQLSDHL